MPTFVRERFLSFSREFALGSTRVVSNLLVREMGKITHLPFPLGFFPQATLPSLKLMALPLGLRVEFGSQGNEPPANQWSILPFLCSRCVTSESDERGVH